MEKQKPIWPKGVSLKPALQQARQAMAALNWVAAASKAGCDYESGAFRVRFLDKTCRVLAPGGTVEEEGSPVEPSHDVQLVLLHYLLNADGTPPAGMWITFRHVPDGMVFDSRFNAMAVEPLVPAFKSDLTGFRKACERLGGIAMSRTGDASYRFMALPQIPMGVVLYLADEEMSASISILFDAVAANYLCAEDLAFLGIHLSSLLLKARG